MKRFALLAVLVFLAGTVAAGPECSRTLGRSPANIITVLHVSDTHSQLDSYGPRDKQLRGTLGGLTRAATVIKAERARARNSLFLHSGDVFQGDLFFNSYFGIPEFQLLQTLGLDAMAVGNHEFDLGPDVLGYSLSQATGPSMFPLVSANLDLTGYPALANWITPSVIKNVGGVKVGIFGLTVPDDVMNMPDPVVIKADVGPIAYATAASLRSSGAQVVICLSHLGLLYDIEIGANVPGIDFILGGHSHDVLHRPLAVPNPAGGVTRIMHAGTRYRHVGRLRFCVKNGSVQFRGYRLISVGPCVRPDPAISLAVDALKDGIAAQFGPVYGPAIASVKHRLWRVNPSQMARRDSPMGNLVSDSYRWLTGTELAIVANGLLAEDLYRGPIVGADVFRVVSYGYDEASGLDFPLVTMEIAGADLVVGLEFGLAYLGLNEDFFLQVSGMRYAYDPEADPGSRVDLESLTVGGAPLDPDRKYTLTVNLGIAYLLPMLGIEVDNVQVLPTLEYEVVRDFVTSLGTVSFWPEGRIIEIRD